MQTDMMQQMGPLGVLPTIFRPRQAPGLQDSFASNRRTCTFGRLLEPIFSQNKERQDLCTWSMSITPPSPEPVMEVLE